MLEQERNYSFRPVMQQTCQNCSVLKSFIGTLQTQRKNRVQQHALNKTDTKTLQTVSLRITHSGSLNKGTHSDICHFNMNKSSKPQRNKKRENIKFKLRWSLLTGTHRTFNAHFLTPTCLISLEFQHQHEQLVFGVGPGRCAPITCRTP